jgi:hypothetical protein
MTDIQAPNNGQQGVYAAVFEECRKLLKMAEKSEWEKIRANLKIGQQVSLLERAVDFEQQVKKLAKDLGKARRRSTSQDMLFECHAVFHRYKTEEEIEKLGLRGAASWDWLARQAERETPPSTSGSAATQSAIDLKPVFSKINKHLRALKEFGGEGNLDNETREILKKHLLEVHGTVHDILRPLMRRGEQGCLFGNQELLF